MNSKSVIIAAIFIVVSIMLGAFGAHGLEGKISVHGIDVWNTASEYQMYAGLGLLVIGLAEDKFGFSIKWFSICLILGSIIFSGLLYLTALQDINASLKVLGAFVPIGGLLMILSWLILIYKMLRFQKTKA